MGSPSCKDPGKIEVMIMKEERYDRIESADDHWIEETAVSRGLHSGKLEQDRHIGSPPSR